MGKQTKPKPGTPPKTDDQGQSKLCTSHALGKAITAEFHDHDVDVRQDTITSLVVNKHGNTEPRYPTEYDGTTVFIQDTKDKKWRHMSVNVVETTYEDFEQNCKKKKAGKFLAVYPENEGPHCIFAQNILEKEVEQEEEEENEYNEKEKKDKKKKGKKQKKKLKKQMKKTVKFVLGLNSWGEQKSQPLIPQNEVMQMYKVLILLQDEKKSREICKTHGFEKMKGMAEKLTEVISGFSKMFGNKM